MFYIVESDDQLELLKSYGKNGGYIEIIPNNDNLHPKLASTVAVYLRPLNHKEGYIIPIDHDEGICISKERLSTVLDEYSTLYTLNRKDLLYHINTHGLLDVSLLYSMIEYDRLDIFNNNRNERGA